jgi:hypothetical protein
MKRNCFQIFLHDAIAHFDEEQFWIIFGIKTILKSTLALIYFDRENITHLDWSSGNGLGRSS